jgi:hypothetical protein
MTDYNILNIVLLFILLIHWFADFVLQTSEQSTNKGKGKSLYNKHLLEHVVVYTCVWVFCLVPFADYSGIFIFAIITFTFHYLTDWCTSRVGKIFWDRGDYHNGFVVVGFDQILHYTQLWLTLQYIL